MKPLGQLTALLVAILGVWVMKDGNEYLAKMGLMSSSYVCEQPVSHVRLLTHDPLMVHIEEFVTNSERQYLLKLAQKRLAPSLVTLSNGSKVQSPHRTSSTGSLPKDDPVVKCLVERAAGLQGFLPTSRIEHPQVTQYETGQEFRHHYDWAADEAGKVRNREATVFVILDSECTNCGTSFPWIEMDWGSRDGHWCRFFECKNDTLVTHPVPGSAIYWRNAHPNGTGDERTLHAGLPLANGFKTGLNIWTRVAT